MSTRTRPLPESFGESARCDDCCETKPREELNMVSIKTPYEDDYRIECAGKCAYFDRD